MSDDRPAGRDPDDVSDLEQAYWEGKAESADKLTKALALLERYRRETPLGHQPHMIAHEVDELLGERG